MWLHLSGNFMPIQEKRNDDLLLRLIAQGDIHALSLFYQQMSPWIFAIILRLVRRRDWAEDILQDVFIQVWHSAVSYDPTLSGIKTWLSHIARHRAIDFVRKREHQNGSTEEIAEAEQAFQTPLEEDEVYEDEARRLQQCLQHLPPEQRQSIALAYYRGLSQQEIAVALDHPVGTVKSWIRRALAHLKECVGL